MQVVSTCLLSLTAAILLLPRTGDSPRKLRERAMESALARAETQLLEAKDLVADHSSWNDPWVVESEFYEVRSTSSYFATAKAGRDLDFMFGEFAKLLDREDYVPAQRFQVWIYPSIELYNARANAEGADEHSSFYGSYFANSLPELPVATYLDSNATRLGMHMTYSACQQFVSRVFGVQLPVWVAEGLASYFTFFWDRNWAAQEFRRIAASPNWVPLRDLVEAPLSAYLANGQVRVIQLGMLFHYLLHERPETRIPTDGEPEPVASFRTYVRELVNGGDGSNTDFAYWVEDQGGLESFEQEFRAFEREG